MSPERSAQESLAALLASPPDLPALSALGELSTALSTDPATPLLLTAPPGTGKTTMVPPHVALTLARTPAPGRVVVTQPRRVAARAAARGLAGLLGEEVGATVGYAVRGERRTSPRTLIEIVTAGLLLRRVQADPALEGVGAVVLDEVHERSLEGDLLLALLMDARAALRGDLPLIAMSATVETDRLAGLLGARVIEAPGAMHPVKEVWAPSSSGRLGPRGVPRELLAHVAATTLRALEEHAGDALVFLPGAREVDDVVARLREAAPAGVEVLPLHGRLPAGAQDAALAASAPGRRRVVVSTNIAESSLTVPGVRIVVDSTLAREPRLDVARSMSGLVTVGASRAAGVQRAGRAGRQGPGVVYRCCSPTDWARAPKAPTPEILSADLTRTALELALWGVPDGAGLAWIDEPPAAAMAAAREALAALGLVADGALTPLGRAVAGVPAQVRPARALLEAAPVLGVRRAAEAAALLTADLRAPGADLPRLARHLRDGAAGGSAWRAEARRLERAAGEHLAGLGREPAGAGSARGPARLPEARGRLDAQEAIALVAALAQPQWLAQRRGAPPRPGVEARYRTVAGTGLRLPADSALADEQWLAVALVDRAPGSGEALIRAAAPIEQDMALQVAARWLTQEEQLSWQGGVLRSERVRRLGSVVIGRSAGRAPGPREVEQAVIEAVRSEGLGILAWDEEARALRARLALLHEHLGEPWPAMDEAGLLERAEEWLGPAAHSAASSSSFRLGGLAVEGALRALLPWPQAAHLEDLAPQRLEVPSGSLVRVDYGQRPTLAVAVQECFGWRETPRIVQGRVPVLIHLLSPARRPVAVTDDLASFWRQGYPQVRAELRGRYPKHAWPEDPWAATPHRGTARRRGGPGAGQGR